MMAESKNMLAASQNSLALSVEKQTSMQKMKDIMAAVQMEYTMQQGVGDLNAARLCISKLLQL
jgi:hypothetical protein